MMLKRYVAETNSKVKDRMILIIKIKHNGTSILKTAESLGKSNPRG